MWVRIPLLAVGLLMLWLGIAIAAKGLFGVTWINGHGSALLGSLVCFLLAALFIFVWFHQLQILFDETRQELVVRTNIYFHVHERRISLIGGREIHTRYFPGGGPFGGGTRWIVTVDFSDGRSEHVAGIPSDIEPFAQSLEAASKLPVKRLSGEKPLDQRSNRDIIIPTVVGTLICGFMIVMNIRLLVIGGNWFSITWGIIGSLFVLMVLLACLLPAIRELRRRRKTPNQKREPST